MKGFKKSNKKTSVIKIIFEMISTEAISLPPYPFKKFWEIGVYPLTATIVLLVLYYFVEEIEQITKELILNTIFMLFSTFT
jgi:hypothetical protein